LSKRSSMTKVPKDYYPTRDPAAIPPKLIEFIKGKTYAEPCCGEGDLVELLKETAFCRWMVDIENRKGWGSPKDAMDIVEDDLQDCDCIITNPPFTKATLLPMIDHFITLKDTWLLLPADMMHNKYFAPYMKKCSKVVSVGRVCWFPVDGKRVAGTDNYAWYFWQEGQEGETPTTFYGRD